MKFWFIGAISMAGIAAPAYAAVDLSAEVTIDKTDYTANYSVGVAAGTSVPVDAVAVTHDTSGPSAGSWSLLPNPDNRNWWSWSPQQPLVSSSNFAGAVYVDATQDGKTTGIEGVIPRSAEIALPTDVSIALQGDKYIFSMAAVPGADFYHIWVWDSVERRYPWSASRVTDLSPFSVDASTFLAGRTYNTYFLANNSFALGDNITGTFRSVALRQFTATTSAVPEPATWALMLLGFFCIGGTMRSKRRQKLTVSYS